MCAQSDTSLAAADRFFGALLAGDVQELEAVFAPGAVLWINVGERERPAQGSLAAYAALKSRVPDLHFEDVRRRAIPGGFLEQHTLRGTAPSGQDLRVVGCFVGAVQDGRITRLEEYVDSEQSAPLSAVLRGSA